MREEDQINTFCLFDDISIANANLVCLVLLLK